MNKLKKAKNWIIAFVVSFVFLVCVVLFIDPAESSIVYVLLPIVLLWIIAFTFLKLVGMALIDGNKSLYQMMSVTISTIGVLLLLLSGLGQLTLRDIVLTLLLTAVGSFYLYRTWSKE